MSVQLHLGDCLEVMRSMPDKSVDAVITSPPYFNAKDYSHWNTYQEYLDFLDSLFNSLPRICENPSILAINLSCVIEPREKRSKESIRFPIPFDAVNLATKNGWKFQDDIVWKKPDGASSRARTFGNHRRPIAYKPFTVTEYILIFKWGDKLLDYAIRKHSKEQIQQSLVPDGYERTNVWEINPETKSEHPAPYPLTLAKKLTEYYSFVGDTILDPFMGSGTTGVACVQTGRNFIGIEIDPTYFAIAEKRIAEAQMQPRLGEVVP